MIKDYFTEHVKGVRVYCLSSDNECLFTTGMDDMDIKMFDLTTGKCTHTFKDAHSDLVLSMEACSGSKSLYTGSMDGWLKEWNFYSKKLTKDYGRVHLGYIGFINIQHFGKSHDA